MGDGSNGPRRVGGTLKQAGGTVGDLYAHARRLREREQLLAGELPGEAREHVRLARLDHDEMLLLTDRPEWRHRLRYLAPRLQDVVERQAGFRPRQVTVRVGQLPERTRQTPPRTLSPAAGRTLASAAAHMPDPRLAAALERLASRTPSDDTDND
ncbi:DciA family protein [Aquisalimonas lutea]|uniref:DciA family protein n=1 Tax=Aquisalimonas lutea TaxID=1327750 RepID=UPI0025B475EE|nr:DciA family protein [Aquisalimonas lutea]MDN3517422.1 DciA family protein [Aquisalimonas lutea]